jgi:alkylation response protein AidB-like acyl-CoA dehydrogenase
VQLILTEDQELLAKTAADFVRERSPVSRVRELRDRRDPVGFSPALWKEMAALGWVGILVPEAHGGAGMGFADLAVVLEALGRTLAPEPFLSAVLLGGQALALGGSPSHQQTWLPRIAAGEAIVTVAYQEAASRYDLARVATRAEEDEVGWRLRGEKVQVPDGPAADAFVVTARSAGSDRDREGITAFLVTKDAPGLEVVRQNRIDGRGAALVRLEGVPVGPEAVLGRPGAAVPLLERVLDRATVGLCAEMLGSMSELFERTLEHLKSRVQFGVPIGSFQALKHRAARLFMEIELARSASMAAARAADEESAELPLLASLAKTRCSDASVLAANEGIQMFGGVGMTDEYDLGFYIKRARVAEMTFGDAAWHRERWARLQGY